MGACGKGAVDEQRVEEEEGKKKRKTFDLDLPPTHPPTSTGPRMHARTA